MKWLFEVLLIGGVIWFVFSPSPSEPVECACSLPEDYFIIETKETQMCVDENRETFVTKIVKHGRHELY